MILQTCVCVQAMAATVQVGSLGCGPGTGQGEDAGGKEVQHSQVSAGGLSSSHAASQQSTGGPQQRHQ